MARRLQLDDAERRGSGVRLGDFPPAHHRGGVLAAETPSPVGIGQRSFSHPDTARRAIPIALIKSGHPFPRRVTRCRAFQHVCMHIDRTRPTGGPQPGCVSYPCWLRSDRVWPRLKQSNAAVSVMNITPTDVGEQARPARDGRVKTGDLR